MLLIKKLIGNCECCTGYGWNGTTDSEMPLVQHHSFDYSPHHPLKDRLWECVLPWNYDHRCWPVLVTLPTWYQEKYCLLKETPVLQRRVQLCPAISNLGSIFHWPAKIQGLKPHCILTELCCVKNWYAQLWSKTLDMFSFCASRDWSQWIGVTCMQQEGPQTPSKRGIMYRRNRGRRKSNVVKHVTVSQRSGKQKKNYKWLVHNCRGITV